MHVHQQKEVFDLRPQEIDRFSAWLISLMPEKNLERTSKVKLRLLAEEILLRFQARFGEETKAEVYLEKRFSKYVLRIEIEGEAFNPLNENSNDLGDWNSALITAVNIDPKYAYSWGKNTLRIVISGKTVNPVVKLCAALALGILLGVCGLYLLPDGSREAVTQTLFSPLYGAWIRILNALSGPVIFFMVITAIINTKQITKQGGTKTFVIGRYFLFSLIAAAFTVLCALPLLESPGANASDPQSAREAFSVFLQLLPKNLFDPFINSDTPQLLLIAVITGSAVIVLGDRVSRLKTVLQQINMIGLLLAKWISVLVPAFTCLFLAFEIWQQNTRLILQIWKPFLLSFGVTALILCASTLWLAFRLRLSPSAAFRKLTGPFLHALRTGADDSAFDETERSCVRSLGIDPDFTKTSLPQGIVLYMPISSVGVLAFTLYAAFVYGITPSVYALVGAIVLSVILFVATPPVPGANLLAYIVLFSRLGVPDAALIDAMIFDIVFGILASAANLTMLQIETALQAKRMGLLNYTKLRKKN